MSTSYDGAGRPETLTYPTGFAVKRLYNAQGYLWELRNAADNTLLWRANSQNAAGQVTGEELGNALVTTRAYDALFRLVGISRTGTPGTAQSIAYSYDAMGNVTRRQDNVDGVDENFTYDTLNRLRQASGPGLTTRTIDYNALGNITYKSDAGPYGYEPVGNVRPHAVASVSGTLNSSYYYDPNGNLLQGAGRWLTYTSFNLPGTLQQGSEFYLQYLYNAEHERVKLVLTRTTGTYTSIYLHPGGQGRPILPRSIGIWVAVLPAKKAARKRPSPQERR